MKHHSFDDDWRHDHIGQVSSGALSNFLDIFIFCSIFSICSFLALMFNSMMLISHCFTFSNSLSIKAAWQTKPTHWYRPTTRFMALASTCAVCCCTNCMVTYCTLLERVTQNSSPDINITSAEIFIYLFKLVVRVSLHCLVLLALPCLLPLYPLSMAARVQILSAHFST